MPLLLTPQKMANSKSPGLHQVWCVKRPSVSGGSWHFDSHSEVSISAISVGTISVANSKKTSVNCFSQRKFHERDGSVWSGSGKTVYLDLQKEENIPAANHMSTEGAYWAHAWASPLAGCMAMGGCYWGSSVWGGKDQTHRVVVSSKWAIHRVSPQ